mgnify:CR=1 FL=1
MAPYRINSRREMVFVVRFLITEMTSSVVFFSNHSIGSRRKISFASLSISNCSAAVGSKYGSAPLSTEIAKNAQDVFAPILLTS